MKALTRLWTRLLPVKPLEQLDTHPRCRTCQCPLLPDDRHDFR